MIYSVYAAALESVNREAQAWFQEGTVANYIPALAQVLLGQFAVSMQCVGVNADPHPENRHVAAGVSNARFSIQSISKVFTMALAMRLVGPSLWERVGREPSGSAFNSLIQLEYEHGIPRNPFINPGALVVADALVSHTPDPKQSIVEFVRELSGSPDIGFDEDVAAAGTREGLPQRRAQQFPQRVPVTAQPGRNRPRCLFSSVFAGHEYLGAGQRDVFPG